LAHDAEDLVCDADVFMNLVASGRFEELLRSSNTRLLVPPAVASEALYLESEVEDGERERIEIAALAEAGSLTLIELAESEYGLLVELAQVVDDGEAQAIAVAAQRGLRLATDDRKARRVAAERGVGLLSTPELVHAWHETVRLAGDELTDMLRRIGRRSRYRPPRDHELYAWWIFNLIGLHGDASA
jgi:predicted nucleic acid-binding protein